MDHQTGKDLVDCVKAELKEHPIIERGNKRVIELTGYNLEDPSLKPFTWFFPWDSSEENRDRKDEIGNMVDAAIKKCREKFDL